MAFRMPQFIVIDAVTSSDEVPLGRFLTYGRDGGESDGYINAMEPDVVNPYAKFEVEFTRTNDLVHIRSCRNNRYWERSKTMSMNNFWMTATAKEKEEDQSKETCTLIRFITVDPRTQTVRLMHVQSGCYLDISSPFFGALSNCVTATHPNFHGQSFMFRIIDWSSLLILPRYLAFKGDNDEYLRVRTLNGMQHLQFSGDDIRDADVALEIHYVSRDRDGAVRVRQINTGRFWRLAPRNSNWILADTWTPGGINQRHNDFRMLKINGDTMALINQQSNMYARRLTADRIPNCLNAQLPRLTPEAWLKVEEPVMRREILRVNYDLENARIYDETVKFVGVGSAVNNTPIFSTLGVEVKVETMESTTWNAHFSLTLRAKATARAGIPKIAEARVEVSTEIRTGIEWEKTVTNTDSFKTNRRVLVPPRHRATIRAIAMEGRCDVPFSFTQRDTLYDGTSVTYDVDGGTFLGVNQYNHEYHETFEPLTN